MTQITTAQVCDAIESTLGAAASLARSQSYNELTEGMNDAPTLQVYPEEGSQDPTGNTDRSTFKAGVRQTELTIHADLYARQRSNIGEDMAKLVTCLDEFVTIFEAQDAKPYFGLVGIKAFSWSWSRVVFQYGDPGQSYMGARFIVRVRIF